jgi:chaperone required for assembly of F1-ATPase
MAELDPRLEARRFYAEVTVGEASQGDFEILLDGRRARTARGGRLALPTLAAAHLLAGEWAAQGPSVERGSMPATRLADLALDGGPAAQAAQIAALERYGASDLLCYFAEYPNVLVERQTKVWGPLLAWAEQAHGLAFASTRGIAHRPQPPATLERLGVLLREADPFALAGLAVGAALFGSTILVLALRAGRIDAGEALDAALVDETFQQAQWGVAPEAAARAADMAAEARVLDHWFGALRTPRG